MLTTKHLEALATVHLHPQTQVGGEIDITALLRAAEAAAAAAERERWESAVRALLAAKWCTPEYERACRAAAALLKA